jgi:Ribbon-helix-helix domain
MMSLCREWAGYLNGPAHATERRSRACVQAAATNGTFEELRLTLRSDKLILAYMGKTKRRQQIVYLDQDKASLLDKLSKDTRVAKQVYLREAVDMLLKKYLKPKR